MYVEDRIRRAGREYLGHGDAGFVLAGDDPARVTKFGFHTGDGWPAWAAWCAANPGPHLPVVHHLHVVARHGFIAVLERLDRTDVAADWHFLKRKPLWLADAIEPHRPSLAVMLRRAHAAFPGARWDMAASNWMMRPGTGEVILSDPLI